MENLRDCYAKHLRGLRTKTGQATQHGDHYKAWPWAKEMEIFKPFLKCAQTESNVTYDADTATVNLDVNDLPVHEDTEETSRETAQVIEQIHNDNNEHSNEAPMRNKVRNEQENKHSSVDRVIILPTRYP